MLSFFKSGFLMAFWRAMSCAAGIDLRSRPALLRPA
jgi:hypothetical protein